MTGPDQVHHGDDVNLPDRLLVPTGGTRRRDACAADRPMPTRTTTEIDAVVLWLPFLNPAALGPAAHYRPARPDGYRGRGRVGGRPGGAAAQQRGGPPCA